jgi:hypothetical protein
MAFHVGALHYKSDLQNIRENEIYDRGILIRKVANRQ